MFIQNGFKEGLKVRKIWEAVGKKKMLSQK
jgi:hypothetical protein